LTYFPYVFCFSFFSSFLSSCSLFQSFLEFYLYLFIEFFVCFLKTSSYHVALAVLELSILLLQPSEGQPLQKCIVEAGRSRKTLGDHVGCPGMAQTTLTWLGTAHAPPHSFIIGWDSPRLALPMGYCGF
jgi:hypothetical protein